MNTKKNLVKVFTTLGVVALGVSTTAAVANADMVYTVQSGDTLSSISYKFAKDNSLISEIAKDNNLSDVNQLHVGQKLLIKGNGEIASLNSSSQNAAASQNNDDKNTDQKASQSANLSSSEQAAKEWIAQRESGGSYTAQNGVHYGRYQLDLAYLGGRPLATTPRRSGPAIHAKPLWLLAGCPSPLGCQRLVVR